MGKRTSKISQNDLFAAIFFELSDAIGDQLASEHIIDAANQLVKLIETDFGLNAPQARAYRANYFSHETFRAIQEKAWQILNQEYGIDFSDQEILDPLFLRNRLTELGVHYD